MNILFVSRKYLPSVGGMELFARDLSVALGEQCDVQLVKWGGKNKYLPVVLPWLALQAFAKLLTGKTDVIHMQDGLLSPLGYVLSKLFRKPYVVVLHGLDITYKNALYQKVVPWAVARASKVICISQAASDEALARGVPATKLQVITLAVNDTMHGTGSRSELLKALELPADTKTLLTVGRLVKRKGVAWFIEHVLPQIVAKEPNTVYLVVGEGSERPTIEAAIQAADMSQHVRLLGRVSDELRASAYNGADVFVMPNINVPGDIEGFGLVLLEASLCARPIVAANTEGIKDAVADGQSAQLVPVQDVQGFVTNITQLLQGSAAAAAFGERSRAYTLQHYSWPVIAKQYLEVYKLIARR